VIRCGRCYQAYQWGRARRLEREPGPDAGYLGDKLQLIAIDKPQGLRMPSGNEPGANEFGSQEG
jgi:hypothetical protein